MTVKSVETNKFSISLDKDQDTYKITVKTRKGETTSKKFTDYSLASWLFDALYDKHNQEAV